MDTWQATKQNIESQQTFRVQYNMREQQGLQKAGNKQRYRIVALC